MSSLPASLGTDDAAWPEDAIEVGRVLDAWGVKGWLKVQPFASDPQALFSSRRWFLKPPDAGAMKRPTPLVRSIAFPPTLHVTQSREHGDWVIAQVQEVADRGAAESLRGARVFVSRQSFPTPDADEFYWVDLIGMAVVNREGESLGIVTDLLDTGPHSVLRIADATAPEGERLVPFVAAYVDDVSLADKRITVDWGRDY